MVCNSDWIKLFFVGFCGVVYRRFGGACCMLAQGQQSRLKSTRPYMYPCWLVTPRICIVSLPVVHVVSRAFVWMSNDERISCSHGSMVCWHFNASRYVVWSVMTLVCVCVCERESVRAELVMAPYWMWLFRRPVYCAIILWHTHSVPPLRGCERVDVVTSLAA